MNNEWYKFIYESQLIHLIRISYAIMQFLKCDSVIFDLFSKI